MLGLNHIDAIALRMLEGIDDGEPLDGLTKSLLQLAVSVSVTALNPSAIADTVAAARAEGATTDQIQETIALVSGLGVHTLMMTASTVLGTSGPLMPLTTEQEALWQRYVGDDPYWADFEQETPGFLDALLRLSPASFQGFFDYCAIPWATRTVPAITKELSALACDAAPTHRFGPGFRHHLRNALKLGAGRAAILETLAIAARAPSHDGVA